MTRPSSPCGCGAPHYSRGLCQKHYRRQRNRQIAYGRWDPRATVSAEAVREHVARMQAVGVGPAQLAKLAGIDRVTVARITGDEHARISVQARDAVLAVPVPERAAEVTTSNALVPIHGAQRRIQALIAFGYPRQELARQLGLSSKNGSMEALVHGRRYQSGERFGRSITAERDRAVEELFDRLQLVPGPSERARAKGRRQKWPLPFEWDEAALDDPHGTPVKARWSRTSATAERREQVAELTERGLAAGQIAQRLGTTERTVVRDRAVAAKTGTAHTDSQVEAMAAVIVQARQDITAARRTARAGRERTR